MLDPRDPNNEIHLVLTPFEAAVLFRFLNANSPYQQTLAEIADALIELIACCLEPSDA